MTCQETERSSTELPAATSLPYSPTVPAATALQKQFHAAGSPRTIFQWTAIGGGDDNGSAGHRAGWRCDGSSKQRKKSIDEDIWRWTFETN